MTRLIRNVLRVLIPLLPGTLIHGEDALAPARSLLADDPVKAFTLNTVPGFEDGAGFRAVEVGGPGFSHALEVATLRDASPLWAVELQAPVAGEIEPGTVGFVRIWIRSLSNSNESGKGHAWLEVSAGPFHPAATLDFMLGAGTEWRQYELPFVFRRGHAPGELSMRLFFGFRPQVVQVGGIEFLAYPGGTDLATLPRTRFSYEGREAGAPWREAALRRIEAIRKSLMTVRVRDARGRPVEGARVGIRQTASSFGFGTAVSSGFVLEDGEDARIYRERILELFNSASLENGLKWRFWVGGLNNMFPRERTLEALRWLREQGLHSRGHVLVWPGWSNLPPFIKELHDNGRDSEIPGVTEAHIREVLRATKGLLDEWDALNEPYTNHDLVDLFDRGIMVDWFRIAAEEAPGLLLYLNDFGNNDLVLDADHVAHFEATAKYLLEQGAPLGGLGLQGHFGAEPSAPADVLATLDRYQALGLPIRFTEFDIWTDDEELQADFTRDFLILSYSHPAVVGVQFWGFWAGRHWRPVSALYRMDWTPKPAAVAYKDLVLGQWRTNVSGESGPDGSFSTRAFHGTYEVTVEAGEQVLTRTVELSGPDTLVLDLDLTHP